MNLWVHSKNSFISRKMFLELSGTFILRQIPVELSDIFKQLFHFQNNVVGPEWRCVE